MIQENEPSISINTPIMTFPPYYLMIKGNELIFSIKYSPYDFSSILFNDKRE
jgi:hypothetical protein